MVRKPAPDPWRQPPQQHYLFTNATIIDPVSGTLRRHATVHLAHGLIQTITDSSAAPPPVPPSTTTLDLTNKYLCPGLIDSHVHITAVPGSPSLASTLEMNPERSTLRQPFVCAQILRRGFTTVRDCGGASPALKEALADGILQGPRLFIAGHALTQTGGHGDLRNSFNETRLQAHSTCCAGTVLGMGRIVDGVDACLAAARDELRQGADFVKIMTSGGVASPTDALDQVQFSAAEVRAITEVASQRGTYVTAHAYTAAAIRHAVGNGVRGIEHGNLVDRETARWMAERGVFLTPTLVTYAEMADEKCGGVLPDELARKNEQVLEAGLRSIRIASEEGVTMCYGTDLLGAMTAAQTREFAIRARVLSPVEILRSATVNPARMLGSAESLGRVEEGFVADLLVLQQNPLEDITVLDQPEKYLLAVLKEGRVQVSRWSKLPQEVFGVLPVIE